MSRPLAEHDGRCSPLLWSGRRRERRGAKKRSLPCLGCRTERGVLRMRRTVPPCDEKFSPLCLKCRTRGRRRGVWRSGGRIFREQGCPCVLPGGRHSCFPRSRARLRHSIRFFHQEVGPDHSAPQAARAAPWSSGEILRNRGIRAGARLLRRGRAQPRALFWKGGESSSRFGHEKRDGPQKARPACFSAAGPDYFQLSMLQCLTRSRSSAALPSLKRSRVPTR